MFKKYNIRDEEIPAMGFFSRFALAEGKTEELELRAIEIIHVKAQSRREKRKENRRNNTEHSRPVGHRQVS